MSPTLRIAFRSLRKQVRSLGYLVAGARMQANSALPCLLRSIRATTCTWLILLSRARKATDGIFVGEVGSYGTGPQQFQAPRGVAVDPSGNYVYVAESYWFNTNAPIRVYAYSALDPLIYAS